MEFPNEIRRAVRGSLPAAMLLSLAMALPSRADGISFNMYQSDQGESYVQTYVDWSAASTQPGHANWDTFTNPFGSVTKYSDYYLYGAWSPTPGRCFEMSTSDWRTNLAADPIIWVKNSSGVWVKLADDVFGTQAYARIFVSQGNSFGAFGNVRFAPYSSFRNNEAMRFQSNWLTDDWNTCMSGTYPAAYVETHGTIAIVRAQ
jgi:hypothetical protein